MDLGNHCLPSIPLSSRLDRLDLIMKYLESKRKSLLRGSENDGGGEKRCVSMNLELREAHSRGSLLDRIASLEHHLIQVYLEVESSSTFSSCAEIESGGSSHDGNGCTGEVARSYPVFSKPNYVPKQPVFETQELSMMEQKRQRNCSKRQRGDKSRNAKLNKKVMTPNWPHLKLLGC